MTTAVPEFPWLLPSALTAEPGPNRPRRSTRDWIVDTICFLIVFPLTLLVAWDLKRPDSALLSGQTIPDWLNNVDIATSFAACAALWVRRRWPVPLAVAFLPLSIFNTASVGVVLVAVFTVAVHRRLAVAAAVAAAHLGACTVYALIRPDMDEGYWPSLLFNVVMSVILIGAVLAWGMFVRARRQLVVSLRDRAHRAEAEQQLRLAQARHLERTRIAREMHDVLAHRISLVSLHAGALEFRPDAPPDEVARAAGVIRTSAHQALEDLRQVIGVLREDRAEAGPERPQPTFKDLPALVAESRQAGMRVDLESRLTDPESVPDGIGRSMYRIVQEGLTNVRKHAPGVAATVTVTGAVETGVSIEVTNGRPVGAAGPAEIPGTGTGLIGLAERIDLVGGRLEYGWTTQDSYRLRAWLPWPA